jgi:hypothetical protein
MKPVHRIVLSLALGTTLISASALAQDSAGPADAPAPAAKVHHHKHKAGAAVSYKTCVKEDEAVAEYYCSTHSEGCDSEKAAVTKECKGEARGERHTG